MQRKLTIVVDADVYDRLHAVVGRRRISRFLNDLARAHIAERDVSAGHRAMAADEEREAEAEVWTDTLLADVANGPS